MVKRAMTEVADDRDGDFVCIGSAFYYIGAAGTILQRLHERSIKEGGLQAPQAFEELVPPEYHEYRSVFSETAFNELPPSRPWDHAIELIPGSEPKFSKLYPMSPKEQEQLDEFLDENLRTGRI